MKKLDDKINIQEKIIDEMFSQAITNPPKDNSFINGYFCKKLEELFRIEIESLGLKYIKRDSRKNTVNLNFLYEKNDKTAGFFRYLDSTPTISMYVLNTNFYGLLSNDASTRIKALKNILKTLFHELRHLKQYLLTQQNISNKNVLRNAKEFLVSTYLPKEYASLYNDNHDNFAIEADAIMKSTSRVNALTKGDYFYTSDSFKLIINEANRDYNELEFNNKVFNRDLFVSNAIDNKIQNDPNHRCFELMPILLKEYNEDGTKKSITELIKNMKNEIDDTIYIIDEEDRNLLVNDIKEFYYELIYNRLVDNDTFELYEATKDFSKEEVIKIINEIKVYFNSEKKRTIKLLKDKTNAEIEKNKDISTHQHPNFNKGSIKYDNLNNTDLLTVEDYIKKLPKPEKDSNKSYLYNTKVFKAKLPNYGYYYLKDNTKISVNAFIDNIFLKEYEKLHVKSNIGLRYSQILYKYVKSPIETEYLINCERINASAQAKESVLNNTLKSPVLTKESVRIDKSVFNLMKIIKDIENPNVLNNICNIMLTTLEAYDDDFCYIFDYNQISYFEMLNKVAKLLNNNALLNPKKIDYYSKFRSNQVIKGIDNELKKYYKLTNKKSIKSR